MSEVKEEVVNKNQFRGCLFNFEGFKDEAKNTLVKMVQDRGGTVSEGAPYTFVRKCYFDQIENNTRNDLYDVNYIYDAITVPETDMINYLFIPRQFPPNKNPMCRSGKSFYKTDSCQNCYYVRVYCKDCKKKDCSEIAVDQPSTSYIATKLNNSTAHKSSRRLVSESEESASEEVEKEKKEDNATASDGESGEKVIKRKGDNRRSNSSKRLISSSSEESSNDERERKSNSAKKSPPKKKFKSPIHTKERHFKVELSKHKNTSKSLSTESEESASEKLKTVASSRKKIVPEKIPKNPKLSSTKRRNTDDMEEDSDDKSEEEVINKKNESRKSNYSKRFMTPSSEGFSNDERGRKTNHAKKSSPKKNLKSPILTKERHAEVESSIKKSTAHHSSKKLSTSESEESSGEKVKKVASSRKLSVPENISKNPKLSSTKRRNAVDMEEDNATGSDGESGEEVTNKKDESRRINSSKRLMTPSSEESSNDERERRTNYAKKSPPRKKLKNLVHARPNSTKNNSNEVSSQSEEEEEQRPSKKFENKASHSSKHREKVDRDEEVKENHPKVKVENSSDVEEEHTKAKLKKLYPKKYNVDSEEDISKSDDSNASEPNIRKKKSAPIVDKDTGWIAPSKKTGSPRKQGKSPAALKPKSTSEEFVDEEDARYFRVKNWWMPHEVPEAERCTFPFCTFEPQPHSTHLPPRKRMSIIEKKILVKYLIMNNVIHKATGKNVYLDMIANGYLSHRSWETLRTNFRNTIVKEVGSYNLDPDFVEKIESMKSSNVKIKKEL